MVLLDAKPFTKGGKGSLAAILRKWDAGSRASRMRQLDEFVAQCQDMTGPQLEETLESGASLLLARVSSWLRLSYALGHSVALQLRAIAVFVAASSGQRFLAEFVEVGGVATVIEILSLPQLPEEDKACAMRLLMAIAQAGRHYKEIVCEGDGIDALEGFMLASKSEDLLEEARDLLVTIGRGNPRFATDVHRSLLRLLKSESNTCQRLACAGLRLLLKVLPSSQLYTTDPETGQPVPALDGSYCEAAVSLLSSFNLQLLYEAGQLFSVLLAIEQLEEPLLRNLLKLLIDAADPKRTAPLHMHMQASAARALGQLVASLPQDRRERVVLELDLVPWLCTLLTRESYSPECQKAAVQSLQLLGICEGDPLEQMRQYMGDQLLNQILDAQDATQAALALTPESLGILIPQIDAFLAVHQRNTRPEALQIDSSVATLLEAQGGAAEGGEGEDEMDMGEEEEDLQLPGFRATIGGEEEEGGAAEEEEAPEATEEAPAAEEASAGA